MRARERSGGGTIGAALVAAWALSALALCGLAGCGLALDLDPPDPQTTLDASVSFDAAPRVDAFVPECEEDEQCSDGSWCSGEEHCEAGRCIDGEPPCPAANACLTRECDDAAVQCGDFVNECADDELCSPEGECIPAPECVDNAECPDDGDPCNGAVACASGRCVMLPPPSCGAGNGCLLRECVAFVGCSDVPHDELCGDDDVSCTKASCAPDGECEQVLDDVLCDDHASCTEDRCAPGALGATAGTGCVHRPYDERCVALFPMDSCAALVCVGEQSGTADGCGLRLDSNRCPIGQTCEHTPENPALGACMRLPEACRVDGECDDGDPCNGREACLMGMCGRVTPGCPDQGCLQGYCDLRGIVRGCALRPTLACFGTP